MNTLITFKVVKDKVKTYDINSAIELAFGEFDRVVKQYTRFNENSELSNLNRNSGKWVKISDEFFDLITTMLELAHKTNGVYDPTVIDFLEVYGYDKNYDFSKLDNPNLDKMVQDLVKKRKSVLEIETNEKEKKVKLMENQRIDLGSIGKGYAVDLAAAQLAKITNNFLIDAGGDIYASGKNQDKQTWRVALTSFNTETEEKESVGEIELENEAVTSSGSWARKVKQFHHIIDPLTGKPTKKKYKTVFVKAKTTTMADAIATAIFVGGEEVAKNLDYDFTYFYR